MAAPFAIKVEHVTKTFLLPHERVTSLKSAVINFRHRNRTVEKQQVLHDVSFEIKKGEFFAIVGRNGSGKSTLLKLLAGIYAPDKGQIHIRGKLTPFIELGVGFNPELTGRENVFLNGALLGFNRKEMQAKYNDIVAFAELERFMDQKLKNYSSGMQVRLAFSIAIRAQSDILLLDEVLAVGDAAFQQKCFAYFEELKRRKQTVVFVSHDMGAVRRFCTSAIYVKDGVIIANGTPEEIADVYVSENLQSEAPPSEDAPTLSAKHKIKAKIIEQSPGKLVYSIDYVAGDDEPVYVGISLLWDGRSIAETVTSAPEPLQGSGTVTYTLDTSILNPGGYRLDAALFAVKDKELVAVNKLKNIFQIKGSDPKRGAAVKLGDTWNYGRE